MSAGWTAWPTPAALAPAGEVRVRLPWVAYPVLAYLAAITIFGKGPTYLGIPPLYWGEVVLALALAWLVDRRGVVRAFLPDSRPLTYCVLGYLGLGAVLVVRGLPSHGELALRDSAMAYYALLFFVGYELARRRAVSDKLWRTFTAIWLLSMVWTMIDVSLPEDYRLSRLGPILPWRGVSVFWSSHKELIQHLGLATILIFGRWYPRSWQKYHFAWAPAAALALVLAAASQGRAEKLSILAAWGLFLALRFAPGRAFRASRIGFQAAFLAVFVLLAAVLLAPTAVSDLATAGNFDRFTQAAPGQLQSTSLWRAVWWKQLVAEVWREEPVWGLGFGTDLSYYNQYLRRLDEGAWPTRSPHNFNLTVLARMGVLGFLLWAGVMLLGVGGLVRAAWSNRGGGRALEQAERAELAFWAAMLLATWVNSTLGVLMEGPVLGIWFWFALGFGTARARCAFAEPQVTRTEAGLRAPLTAGSRPAISNRMLYGEAR